MHDGLSIKNAARRFHCRTTGSPGLHRLSCLRPSPGAREPFARADATRGYRKGDNHRGVARGKGADAGKTGPGPALGTFRARALPVRRPLNGFNVSDGTKHMAKARPARPEPMREAPGQEFQRCEYMPSGNRPCPLVLALAKAAGPPLLLREHVTNYVTFVPFFV